MGAHLAHVCSESQAVLDYVSRRGWGTRCACSDGGSRIHRCSLSTSARNLPRGSGALCVLGEGRCLATSTRRSAG